MVVDWCCVCWWWSNGIGYHGECRDNYLRSWLSSVHRVKRNICGNYSGDWKASYQWGPKLVLHVSLLAKIPMKKWTVISDLPEMVIQNLTKHFVVLILLRAQLWWRYLREQDVYTRDDNTCDTQLDLLHRSIISVQDLTCLLCNSNAKDIILSL